MSLVLSISTLTLVVSCGEDEEVTPNTQQNGNQNSSNLASDKIVVTIGADGKANGGHRFVNIDGESFYIDDIKYTASQGFLIVTGYSKAFFTGEAIIISQLNYDGRELRVIGIGDSAFEGCTVLTSATIPSSVTNIGDKAFYGCLGLTVVYCYAETVPHTGSYVFYNSNIAQAKLYVTSVFNVYRTTAPWSGFGSIDIIPIR